MFVLDKQNGFTLSEILITLVILGFIGALGVPMLAPQKVKKPVEIKTMHGTMECFWQDNRLMQFTSNNTDNTAGELKDVTSEGACYFSAPSANMFLLQAIGAGGGGAVGLSGIPTYVNDKKEVSGSIPTGTDFLAAISDTEKVPNWVREEWSKLPWKTDKSLWVKYTLESPLGSSGAGDCRPVRIDVDRDNNYNDCSMSCAVHIEDCPPNCIKKYPANGGNSGNGAKFFVRSPLEYYVDGIKDNVSFVTSAEETTLRIGEKYLTLKPSGNGGNGKVTINYLDIKTENGQNGKDFDVNSSDFFSLSNMDIISKQRLTNYQKGGIGCQSPNKGAVSGNIKLESPKSINYYTEALAIRAKFGLAGISGQNETKILEKLPVGTELKLVPAKNNKEGAACRDGYSANCSDVYIQDKGTGEWKIFTAAKSGSDSTGGWSERIAIDKNDLPFPKAYYPDGFLSKSPEITLSSSKGYTSYLAMNNIIPGRSGEGAHPIVTHVTGNAVHRIYNRVVGTEALQPISSSDVTCFDGSSSTTGYCGSGNTKGAAGAVIVSW